MKATEKTNRKRNIAASVSIIIVVALVGAGILTLGTRTSFIQPAQAKVEPNAEKYFNCSESTLSGKYAVLGSGFVPNGAPPAPMVPFAITSLMTMDGEGGLTNKVTVNRNGQVARNFDTGTYTVNEDCTGTMTINIPTAPFQLTFDLVISDFHGNQGSELYFIQTGGSVVTHTAKRISLP
jgi:hypothetical protein